MPVMTDEEQQEEMQKSGTKIYFSRAAKHQIGNWQVEVKRAGHIDQQEKSLMFHDNALVTSDKKMQKFIEKSGGFKAGDVVLCVDQAELERKRAERGQRKLIQTTQSTDITTDGVATAS